MTKRFMIEAPAFDANAARYALHLLERVQISGPEAQAFLQLQLSLQEFANPTEEAAETRPVSTERRFADDTQDRETTADGV